MTSIKAVIFDLGGTLLHYNDPQTADQERHFRRVTHHGILNIYHHLLEHDPTIQAVDDLTAIIDRHIARAVQAMRPELRGGTIEKPIREMMAEVGAAIDDEQWAELRRLFYKEIDPIVFPREGAYETLGLLTQRGYQLAIISNTFWAADLHDRHLSEHDLLKFIPLRVYSTDTLHTKPHPSIFLDTVADIKVEPSEAVYVGDRLDVDVEGAQQAGLKGILIESPYRTETFDRDIIPDAVIPELPALPDALDRLEVA